MNLTGPTSLLGSGRGVGLIAAVKKEDSCPQGAACTPNRATSALCKHKALSGPTVPRLQGIFCVGVSPRGKHDTF